MSKGKRYETEGQLNYQKVFAVIIALIVLVMFVIIIKNVIAQRKEAKKESEYFTIYSANKYGVIDAEGNEVIAPSYQEMIVIPDKEKDVFICIYDINDETGEYKTKALNKENEEIFTQYEQIEPIENADQNENTWYEENVLRVKKDGKYGLIDLNGKEILNCEYETIYALNGIENSLIIQKDGKVGLANNSGSIIVEPNYKEIKNLGETYKEGYITITEDGKYGLVSTTKKQLLENNYEEIMQVHLENYYLIKEAGVLKLIDSSGTVLLDQGFEDIKSATTRGVIFTVGGLYGEMSTTGEILIEAKYQDLREEKEGIYIAKQNDLYGIIDNQGNEKVPFQYTGITYNQEADINIAEDAEYNTSIIDSGYNVKLKGILSEINTEKSYIRMRIDDEYKYYNFKLEEKPNTEILTENTIFLSKKDGKYGYVDKKGNVVVDYTYDDATEQNEYGFASVKKNGVWGSINKEGKTVIEPTYNLDNYLVIDFIGKWHLGQDLNMNYYCEQ